MKIGFVIVSNFVGGAEREVIDDATAMREDYGISILAIIDANNTALAALLDENDIPYETGHFQLKREDGVATTNVNNFLHLYAQVRRLREIQKHHALDLLITYSFHSGVIGSIARLLGMRAKLVVRQVLRRDLTRGGMMERLQFYAADAVTYNSNAMRLSFEPLARRYRRPERVVYSYVKKPIVQGERGDRERIIGEFGLTRDTTIVGFFGHIFENKQVPDAIEAIALLNAAAPKRFFLLVVGGALRPADYEAEVRALAAAKCPGAHGFLPFASNPFQFMAACDVVVQPSVEPFGRILVEAMHLGVPFVAPNLAGSKEIMDLADPRCGRLVPPTRPDRIAAAIMEIAQNPSAGQPVVPRALSRDAIIDGAVEFYQTVLGKPAGARKRVPVSGRRAMQRLGASMTPDKVD